MSKYQVNQNSEELQVMEDIKKDFHDEYESNLVDKAVAAAYSSKGNGTYAQKSAILTEIYNCVGEDLEAILEKSANDMEAVISMIEHRFNLVITQ